MSLSLGSFPFSRTELNGDSRPLSGSAESTRWSEHGVTSCEKEAQKCASGHKRMCFDGVACADRQRCPSDTFGGFFELAFGVVGCWSARNGEKVPRVPHPEFPSIKGRRVAPREFEWRGNKGGSSFRPLTALL